mmetsp:Transcript_76782/g.217189  ORF Transcript_76782/g.217189 Transcript_76782/m.217189 type:complete len:416 (+) Transcript_76782:28-1275(+)
MECIVRSPRPLITQFLMYTAVYVTVAPAEAHGERGTGRKIVERGMVDSGCGGFRAAALSDARCAPAGPCGSDLHDLEGVRQPPGHLPRGVRVHEGRCWGRLHRCRRRTLQHGRGAPDGRRGDRRRGGRRRHPGDPEPQWYRWQPRHVRRGAREREAPDVVVPPDRVPAHLVPVLVPAARVVPALLDDPGAPPSGQRSPALGPHYTQEELKRQQRVAPGGVRAAVPLQPVLAGQALEGAVGQLVPQLVAPGAEERQGDVEGPEVPRERPPGREQLQEVPEVVGTRERDPPGREPVLAHEHGAGEPPPERRRLDALRRVPREVDARGPEERHGLLRVQVDVDVEVQVEAPDTTENTICARDSCTELDWPQAVDVLTERLVACGRGSGPRLLAQESRELHVQRHDSTARLTGGPGRRE